MNMDFPISSQDCQLLLLLEMTGSLRDAARELRRDISVVSRQIARLSEIAPVVEKIDGKWQVSALGKQFTSWTRDSILHQTRLLQGQTVFKIATTREFASRILAPQLHEIVSPEDRILVEILSSQQGVEELILKGEADFGLDCGRPRDPSVKFQRIAPENFVIVAAPKFLAGDFGRGKKSPEFAELLGMPHLQYSRMSSTRVLRLERDVLNPYAMFNDIAAQRSACVSGLGWAVLPAYTVREELESGKLVELRGKSYPRIEPESFGVWWLRDRRNVKDFGERLLRWLKKQSLN
jgi:DNA-binding transcriptional LysR family regulator